MIFCKKDQDFQGLSNAPVDRSKFGVLFFLLILGASKCPDRAQEVDFPPVGLIWKGFEAPRGRSKIYQNLENVRGVLGRNECSQCTQCTECIQWY